MKKQMMYALTLALVGLFVSVQANWYEQRVKFMGPVEIKELVVVDPDSDTLATVKEKIARKTAVQGYGSYDPNSLILWVQGSEITDDNFAQVVVAERRDHLVWSVRVPAEALPVIPVITIMEMMVPVKVELLSEVTPGLVKVRIVESPKVGSDMIVQKKDLR